MQEAQASAELEAGDWELALYGTTLDDRGEAASEFVRKNSAVCRQIVYNESTFTVSLGTETIETDELEEALTNLPTERVVLEATTLGFVEIFLLLKALFAKGHTNVDVSYVEPRSYSTPDKSLLSRRTFDLSEEFPGYRAIPGATLLLTEQRPSQVVFLLGYEERRLDRAFEDFQMLDTRRCSVVFGVPAFSAGWETNSFANNIRVIRDKNLRGGVLFCGAENPAAIYELLEVAYTGLNFRERLVVAPIGTKPCGVGAAAFAASNSGVGLLYDHPRRREGRSEELGRWHLYSIVQSAT